jgi:tight adherence protein C
MLLLLAVLMISAAVFVAATTLTTASRRRHSAVVAVRRSAAATGDVRRAVSRSKAIERLGETLGRRLLSERLADRLPQRLASAGFGGRVTIPMYVTFRLMFVVLGFLVGLIIAVSGGATFGMTLVIALLLGAVCFVTPGFVLSRRATARREEISDALPDALDLLAVTVEAGLGLYGAIARLVECTKGALSDEFSLVLTELRVGDSSDRALKRMAARLDTPEVTSVVRSLIQGEQLGLSLGQTLRNLADDSRRRRRSVAEENAAKAPVKMLFPAALFIFPSLFVVILGPAVLELGKYL